MLIIPPHTRTIYLKARTIFLGFDSDKYQENFCGIDEIHKIYKFKLNLPQMAVSTNGLKNQYFPIDDNGKQYLSPLTNTNENGEICTGNQFKSDKKLLETIYTTYFNFDRNVSVGYCIKKNYGEFEKYSQILQHLQDWETKGKIDLITS